MLLGSGEGRGDGVAPSTLQGGHGRVFSHRHLPSAPGEAGVPPGFLRLALGIPCLLSRALPASLPWHCLHPSPGRACISAWAEPPSLPWHCLHPFPGIPCLPSRALPASLRGTTACIPA